MKVKYLFKIFFIAALSGVTIGSRAQVKKLIHFWDFNNTSPLTGLGDAGGSGDSLGNTTHPLPADYTTLPLSGEKIVYSRPATKQAPATKVDSVLDNEINGSFYYDYSSTNYTYYTVSDSTAASGPCACSGNLSIRARNPSLNSYLYMYVPTTGYMNILLDYAVSASSNKAAEYNIFSYSTDGGTTWNNLTQAMDTFNIGGVRYPDTLLSLNSVTTTKAWYPVNIDFTTANAANNNAGFIIRFYLAGPNSTLITGSDRYDNISIKGDSICPYIWSQPKNVSICPITDTYFATGVTALNATYQWQVNNGSGFVNVINGGVYSGATTDSLMLTKVPSTMNGYTFRCIIICAACKNDTTTNALLTLNTWPTVTATATPDSICAGGGPVTVNAGGALTYTWTGGVTSGVPFTPGATETYTVTGTNAGGCTDTAVVSVKVNPLPTVTANALPSDSVCQGSSVTLSGGGAATYTWSGGVTNGVPFTPAANQTYTVTGTSVSGCVNTATVKITLNPVPTVTATASPTAVCQGGNVTLTGGGATSYTWSGGVTNGVPFAIAATQTYTVTGTNSHGCTSKDSITVTVNPLPTVTANASKDSVCSGSNVILTGGGALSYTWTGGATNAVAFTPVATQTYTVTGTDSKGCTDTASIKIKVNPVPVVGTTVSPADSVCAGGSVTLTGTGATTYTWSGGVTNAVAFTPVATQTYTVTGTNTSGCSSTANVTIKVNPLPVITVTPPAPTICFGSNINLTAGGASKYTWSPATSLTCTNCPNPVASPAATTSYEVIGTSISGCIDSAKVTVTVAPKITPAISGKDTICSGNSTTLTASGGSTYLWSTGAATAAITVSPAANKTYTVVATSGGCSDSTSVNIVVNPTPAASVSGIDSICTGSSTTLTASGGTTYAWSNGKTSASILVTPPSTTTYSVVVGNGLCTADTSITVTVLSIPVPGVTPPQAICAGSSATLTATGGTKYTWSTGAKTATISVTPLTTSTYTVTVSNGACSKDTVTTVTVNPVPVPVLGGNTAICSGKFTILTASGGTSYLWSNGPATSADSVTPVTTTTYTVQVSNGLCIKDTTVTVTVTPTPVPTVSPTQSICIGNSANLSASGAATYLWSPPTGLSSINIDDPVAKPIVTTTYTVILANGVCTAEDSVKVIVNPLPFEVATPTPATINIGQSVTLTVSPQLPGSIYDWSPSGSLSCNTCPDPSANPLVNTTYYVITTDGNGCQTEDTVQVNVTDICGHLFVPNVFSPNGDGHNDVLYVYGLCVGSMDFIVYDRWGNKIFESMTQNQGWDGTYRGQPMNPDVYAYYLWAKLLDGTEVTKSGNVTLVK